MTATALPSFRTLPDIIGQVWIDDTEIHISNQFSEKGIWVFLSGHPDFCDLQGAVMCCHDLLSQLSIAELEALVAHEQGHVLYGESEPEADNHAFRMGHRPSVLWSGRLKILSRILDAVLCETANQSTAQQLKRIIEAASLIWIGVLPCVRNTLKWVWEHR